MRRILLVTAAAVALVLTTATVVAFGDGEPPPDPNPLQPRSDVAARAQNELVLRGVELNDLLLRAAGSPVPCEDGCVKDRAPEAVHEFVGNTCHVVRSLGFLANYARDSAREIIRLAAVLAETCDRFDARAAAVGPLDDSAEWRAAASRMQRPLPAVIEPAAIRLAEVLK